MKRFATRALLLLSLGALINLAVAWACAIWSPSTWSYCSAVSDPHGYQPPDPSSLRDLLRRTPPPWLLSSEGRIDHSVFPLAGTRGFGLSEHLIEVSGNPWSALPADARRTLLLVTAGWPLPALVGTADGPDGYEWFTRPRANSPPPLIVWHAAAPAPGMLSPSASGSLLLGRSARALPLRPLIDGLVINSLVYSLLLSVPIGVFHVLRSTRRAARKLCTRCAYPIGTSPICSECGKPHHRTPAPKAAP